MTKIITTHADLFKLLLAQMRALGLTLVDVNPAMVIILGLDRMGLLRNSGAGSTGSWVKSAAGERDLGVRVRLS